MRKKIYRFTEARLQGAVERTEYTALGFYHFHLLPMPYFFGSSDLATKIHLLWWRQAKHLEGHPQRLQLCRKPNRA